MIPNDDPPEQFANHYSDDNSSIVHLFILWCGIFSLLPVAAAAAAAAAATDDTADTDNDTDTTTGKVEWRGRGQWQG